jgi:hypothetical protein
MVMLEIVYTNHIGSAPVFRWGFVCFWMNNKETFVPAEFMVLMIMPYLCLRNVKRTKLNFI